MTISGLFLVDLNNSRRKATLHLTVQRISLTYESIQLAQAPVRPSMNTRMLLERWQCIWVTTANHCPDQQCPNHGNTASQGSPLNQMGHKSAGVRLSTPPPATNPIIIILVQAIPLLIQPTTRESHSALTGQNLTIHRHCIPQSHPLCRNTLHLGVILCTGSCRHQSITPCSHTRLICTHMRVTETLARYITTPDHTVHQCPHAVRP